MSLYAQPNSSRSQKKVHAMFFDNSFRQIRFLVMSKCYLTWNCSIFSEIAQDFFFIEKILIFPSIGSEVDAFHYLFGESTCACGRAVEKDFLTSESMEPTV